MCIICTGDYDNSITTLECCHTVSVIPDTLVNLTTLYCSYTEVSVIPDTLVNLKRLQCSNTKVSVIPDTIVNLTRLSCSDTRVSVIPDTINLTKLQDINYKKYNVKHLRKFQKICRKKIFLKRMKYCPLPSDIVKYVVVLYI